MKKARDIIYSLQSQPQFQKLQTYQCIDTVLSLLLPSVKRFIEFTYIKNAILFVALSHNGGKQEFDNNIKMVKDILNLQKPDRCKGVEFHDIRSFVTHTPRKRQKDTATKTQLDTIPIYIERASGEFDTQKIQDPDLQAIAKEIQRIIVARNQN
ncbi:MAG: hypothetical protein GXO11_07135 [Epsilonproteobacteria bacterium]|nr:hypothetical protein [Campylobacterota bacterium]